MSALPKYAINWEIVNTFADTAVPNDVIPSNWSIPEISTMPSAMNEILAVTPD